jgi:hypothetical protein
MWKGQEGRQANTLVFTTSRSTDSCDYDFEKGKEYVVYAQGGEESLQTNLCSRTQLVAYAYDDLAYLGEGHTSVPGQPIVAKEPGHSLLPFVGIGAAVTLAIVFFTLGKSKQQG